MKAVAFVGGMALIVAAFFHNVSDALSTVALVVGFYQVIVVGIL